MESCLLVVCIVVQMSPFQFYGIPWSSFLLDEYVGTCPYFCHIFCNILVLKILMPEH